MNDCLNFNSQEMPYLNEFTDINISKTALGGSSIMTLLFTGSETFIRTNKNSLYQIGGAAMEGH